MAEKKEFSPMLASVNSTYLPLIERQMGKYSIAFTEYQKKCILNGLGSINQMLDANGVSWTDPQLDQSNITQILFNIASLELNSVAQPSECYFQLRSFPIKDSKGNLTGWKKKIEMGIEGDGHDRILARFGRDVEKVYPHWIVRENDEFEYPEFNGLEMTPPKWKPKGTGKAVKVVYPILHKDKTIHYYIAEREDVKRNVLAQINNNLMNETFGIVKDRKDATPQQKQQIAAKKKEIKDRASAMTLEAIISDSDLAAYISPTYKEDFSQEEMIIRKMRNNITKKIPKCFDNPVVQEAYMEVTDENYRKTKEDIIDHTASVVIEELPPSDAPEGGKFQSDVVEGRNTQTEVENAENGENSVSDRVKPDFS